jgi:hypothetical protein
MPRQTRRLTLVAPSDLKCANSTSSVWSDDDYERRSGSGESDLLQFKRAGWPKKLYV